MLMVMESRTAERRLPKVSIVSRGLLGTAASNSEQYARAFSQQLISVLKISNPDLSNEAIRIVEEEVAKGTLWVGDYRCPECDGDRIFVVLMQTRSSDEPETKICTCEGCGHKFREYQ